MACYLVYVSRGGSGNNIFISCSVSNFKILNWKAEILWKNFPPLQKIYHTASICSIIIRCSPAAYAFYVMERSGNSQSLSCSALRFGLFLESWKLVCSQNYDCQLCGRYDGSTHNFVVWLLFYFYFSLFTGFPPLPFSFNIENAAFKTLAVGRQIFSLKRIENAYSPCRIFEWLNLKSTSYLSPWA